MLVTLHLSIWMDLTTPVARALLLVHLGLFLLWQPIHKSNLEIKNFNALVFILITLSFVYWISWGLISIWIILLIGLVGGRVFTNKVQRNVYLLVMIFFIFELITATLPEQFNITNNPAITEFSGFFIPMLLITIFLFPRSVSRKEIVRVDLLQAVTAALLAAILSLGTLVIYYHLSTDYYTALFQTLIVIGLFLILISWLISPHTGFSGLSQLWTQSLLNIGTPFEEWLIELSKLGEKENLPDHFLDKSLNKLLSLPWIAGVCIEKNSKITNYGNSTPHKIHTTINGHPVTLFTQISVGGALLLHCNLLIHLIDNFYVAKINERELAKQTHLQAIHETGSRITHDIKNLLQSMYMMTSALETDSADKDEKSTLALIKKQIPTFIQRLETAISKLQAPQKLKLKKNYISEWWDKLQIRYKNNRISFISRIESEVLIPAELFDSVSENLLENSLAKQNHDNNIDISVTLSASETGTTLSVKDTGNSIDDTTMEQLFNGPLESNQGLGVGLYQAAKLAESLGYKLEVKDNENGNVCLMLSSY